MADPLEKRLFPALLLAFVAACGGGGGGGGNTLTPADSPDPPTVEPPPDPVPVSDAFACGSAGATAGGTADSFVLFESGAVRPLALSSDGKRLLFTNTPANCLEVYSVSDSGFELESAVMVGLEPVAVAFRDDNEAWVVNHLSDSVSIVELGTQPRVRQTLQVGDEPRDILFAGADGQRAFVTAAYRGQNHPTFDADHLVEPGLGRADVWVYDATAISQSLTGNPLAIVNLFADTPRALAASADGATVYAAAFMSGNQSTALAAEVVAGAKPAPNANHEGEIAPETGLVVKKHGTAWVDEDGTDWSGELRLDLPDLDVFAIDAMAPVPTVTSEISGVGTTLFNMAVNPVSGELYVSNLEALNHIRFEGPGELAESTVRGRIAESRITVIDGSNVTANHLNPHVNFDVPEGSSYPPDVVAQSINQPTALAVSPDGDTLYVAAFGSGKVVAIPTAQLGSDSYAPNPALQVSVPGGGPMGLVLTPDGERAVVYSRFDHSLSLWNATTGAMLAQRAAFSPEPDQLIAGRRFLYDARETSANGTSACSSCHIFGDMDQLAWDLGNPDGDMQENPNEYVSSSPKTTFFFHPMKGPMTTQTLRGIDDSGPQHWRGDRTGQTRTVVNGQQESLEAAAFKEFNPAFVGLVGRASELPTADMQAFTDFAMALTLPPNPIRRLDNTLTAEQTNGRDIYFNVSDVTGIGSCNDCHTLDPLQNHFGTSGLMSFEGDGIAENFKVPHIRNAYAKVGMFGTSGRLDTTGFTGDQVKGFGYLHDGSIATLLDFFASPTFNFPAPAAENQADMVRFVMAADSNLAPIVGQQVTIHPQSSAAQLTRLDLLEARALVTAPRPECDLVARGVVDDLLTSAVMASGETGYTDTNGRSLSPAELLAMAQGAGNSVTYTCVPPGSGRRLALDAP
jgi:DNA-binding beta-propeller fold protein YncE